jgi:hypothetical protein
LKSQEAKKVSIACRLMTLFIFRYRKMFRFCLCPTLQPPSHPAPPGFWWNYFFPLLFIASEIKSDRDDVESFLNLVNAIFCFPQPLHPARSPLQRRRQLCERMWNGFHAILPVSVCCLFEWEKKTSEALLNLG